MNICKKNIFLFCLIFFNITLSYAQKTIYEWTTHVPGMKVINVEKVNEKIYAATPYEIFYYNTGDNSINKLTKVNGLSDFGINIMRYNPHTDMIFIGYSNANIDIIDKNENITNISDIKNKSILGNKSINDVYFIDDKAYLCCGFGIVLIDLKKMEIKDTYIIGKNGSYLNINDITLYNDKLYAATSNGIYYADYHNENLVDFSQWTFDTTLIHNNLNYSEIETFNGQLLANYSRNEYNTDTLFVFDGEKWDYHSYTYPSIKRNIRAYEDRIVVSEHFSFFAMDTNNNIIHSYKNKIEPFDCIYDKNKGAYWIADKTNSIYEFISSKSCNPIVFNGPYSNSVFELKARGEQLWVAPGGYSSTWAKNWIKEGVFYYTNNEWNNINHTNTKAFDTISDIVSLAIDPINNSKVYVGSYHKGILEFENFKLKNIYNKENSSLGELSGYGYTYITGMDFDSKNNLWVVYNGTGDRNPLHLPTTHLVWLFINLVL